MAELAVRAADALELEVAGIDILFDEEGDRICEANSAPGFRGSSAPARSTFPARSSTGSRRASPRKRARSGR
ncbi:hypothetical protein ACFONB_04825 [Sphingopyxis italica]|uniref:hypothetical protein n=1 Tax=Sphingopyxis italica TaxID=1129133 RepID=UPI001439AE9F|nr:hypothetical protein [Sphingopyxis italica]